ncbi:hypothetical protein [Moorena sp. SIO4A5]|uniref:hypothetical protein n=1 Tax=Moorena sp. SIO4A5 TaxID=2607838 RepID=UPI0013CBED28|nr:hypothetical protein [Moorena sp. SIO4A5]NEO23754.1 hypothetical protein [Moorena sp. SIO4A5]
MGAWRRCAFAKRGLRPIDFGRAPYANDHALYAPLEPLPDWPMATLRDEAEANGHALRSRSGGQWPR